VSSNSSLFSGVTTTLFLIFRSLVSPPSAGLLGSANVTTPQYGPFITDFYGKPWYRVCSYLVGALTGYFLYKTKDKLRMNKVCWVFLFCFIVYDPKHWLLYGFMWSGPCTAWQMFAMSRLHLSRELFVLFISIIHYKRTNFPKYKSCIRSDNKHGVLLHENLDRSELIFVFYITSVVWIRNFLLFWERKNKFLDDVIRPWETVQHLLSPWLAI